MVEFGYCDIEIAVEYVKLHLNLDTVTSIFEFGYVKLLVNYVNDEKANDEGRGWFSNIFQVLLN